MHYQVIMIVSYMYLIKKILNHGYLSGNKTTRQKKKKKKTVTEDLK